MANLYLWDQFEKMKHTTRFLFALFLFVAFRASFHLKWIHFPPDLVRLFGENELFANFIKIFLLCIPLFLLWRRYKYCERFNQLPGFKTRFGLLGNLSIMFCTFKRVKCAGVSTSELINAIHHIVQASGEKSKKIFTIWAATQPFVLVMSPDLIRELVTVHSGLKKGRLYKYIAYALGGGLITSSGPKWFYHRKLLNPTFNFKVFESFMPNIQHNVRIFISKVEEEANSDPDRLIKDFRKYTFPCTLDVLCQSAMGLDVQAQLDPNSNFRHTLNQLIKIMNFAALYPINEIKLLPSFRPFTKLGRCLATRLRDFQLFTDQVVNDRLAVIKKQADLQKTRPDSEANKGFIDTLLREHMSRPEQFSLVDVRDEVCTFTAAGQDTTGWTITYACFLLGHHPDVQAKVHEELDTFFSNFEDDRDITIDSLRELKYLDAVIKETLRLYAPIPIVTRVVEKDLTLGSYVIPSGAEVVIAPTLVHRDPEYWSQPNRFKPERFLDLQVSHPFAFIPFLAGPRNCIGQKYAMVQMKCILAFVLKHYIIQSLDQIDCILQFGGPVAQTTSPIRVKLLDRKNI